jgi:hypothetical protein
MPTAAVFSSPPLSHTRLQFWLAYPIIYIKLSTALKWETRQSSRWKRVCHSKTDDPDSDRQHIGLRKSRYFPTRLEQSTASR